VNPQGGFSIEAPPGSYDLWVLAPNFQELKLKLDLAAGAEEQRNLRSAADRTPVRLQGGNIAAAAADDSGSVGRGIHAARQPGRHEPARRGVDSAQRE
jgi:hypothetical protein